jgi:ABC-type multidrug transport system ATPase subunit
MQKFALKIASLTKDYKTGVHALDHVDFEIKK